MKLIKLTFAVLALMSVFTACTKEEFTPKQEVAEAKLLGTNLSVDFTFDSQTKVDADGNWTSGDKLGLAWYNGGGIWANHLFVKESDASAFTTYGNVYEGWHFAYYPYAYDKQIGGDKTFEINPEQTETIDKDIFKTRLHLSVLQDLNSKYNLENDKLVNTHFTMRRAVKALNVGITPDDDIKSSPVLAALKIKSVELSANEDIFRTGNVTVDPTQIPEPYFTDANGVLASKESDSDGYKVYPVGAVYNEEKTVQRFYSHLKNALTGATASKTIKTEVDNEGINLSEKENIRFYTLPVAGVTPTASNMKLIVYVQNGRFELPYATVSAEHPELTEMEIANNAQFAKLADAFATTNGKPGYLAAFTPEHEAELGLSLNFTITADMFEQSFNNIQSEQEWNDAVKMVDALNFANPIFTIKKKSGSNWEFKDIDNDGNLINLPATAKLTVDGEKMILNKANASWPNQTAPNNSVTPNIPSNFTINTNVEVKADLNVAGRMVVESGNTITNKAIINAGASSNIPAINNENGKIIVEFGAKVDVNTGGTVAYVVEDADKLTIAKINTLIDPSKNGDKVKVNTLIVKSALNLNAEANSSVDGAYGSGANLADLSDVAIVLNGGSVNAGKVGSTWMRKVKSVIAEAGTTSINGITLNGNSLKVKAGTMTATDVVFDSNDIVSVDANATLNISESGDANIKIGALTVNGNANYSIAGSTVKELVVGANGNLIVNGQLIWTDKNDLKGYTNGVIARGAQNEDELNSLLALASNGSTVYLANDFTVSDLDIFGNAKNVTVNFNKNAVTVTDRHVDAVNLKVAYGIINSELYLRGANTTFTNVKFNIGTVASTGAVQVASGNVTLNNCTFNTAKLALETISGFSGEMNVTNSSFLKRSGVSYDNANYPYVNPFNGKVKFTGCTFAMPVCLEFVGNETRTTVTGNNFYQLDFTQNAASLNTAALQFIQNVKSSNTFTKGFFGYYSSNKYSY